MDQPLRPTKEQIQGEDHKRAIFEEGLQLSPPFRNRLDQLYESSKRDNDNAATAYYAFALAYSLDHFEPYDHQKAIRLLGDALALYPSWPEALFNKAVAEIHARDFNSAIGDLSKAESNYFGGATSNFANPAEAELTRAKVHMFRAEALVGRNQTGDRDLARSELLRAEAVLYRILDKASSSAERTTANFWLKQIFDRLERTGSSPISGTTQVPEPIRHPVSFFIGMLLTPLLLWWLICLANSAKPLPKSAEAEKTKQNTLTSGPGIVIPTPLPASNPKPVLHHQIISL